MVRYGWAVPYHNITLCRANHHTRLPLALAACRALQPHGATTRPDAILKFQRGFSAKAQVLVAAVTVAAQSFDAALVAALWDLESHGP